MTENTTPLRGPPKDERWVWITEEMMDSDSWRSLGINARRLIDFLIREHIKHGMRENGRLKAPYEQLQAFGVGARYVADAIREAEELGLIDCYRGGMKVATRYALTWLPPADQSPPSNRWRSYCNPALKPLPQPENKNLPAKGKAELPAKGKADGPNLPAKGKADGRKTTPKSTRKREVPIKSSYQGRCHYTDGGGDA